MYDIVLSTLLTKFKTKLETAHWTIHIEPTLWMFYYIALVEYISGFVKFHSKQHNNYLLVKITLSQLTLNTKTI